MIAPTRQLTLSIVVLLAVILGGLAVPLLATTSEVTATSAGNYDPNQQECVALKRMNDFRRSRGKSQLVLSKKLGAAAEHHSRDMARYNYVSHYLQGENINWDKNVWNHNYTGTLIGENIAAGDGVFSRGAEVVRQWRRSDDHRKIMVNGRFKAVGISRVRAKNAKYDWYWTANFGSGVSKNDTIRC